MHTSRSIVARLCASSALTGVAAALAGIAASPASAQDTGQPCNIVGSTSNPACDLSTPVINGSDGPGAKSYENGKDGTIGAVGGDIIADLKTPRMLSSVGPISPVNAVTIGGKGGNGSNSDPAGDSVINLNGGSGQPGQNGGTINLTVESALSGDATYYVSIPPIATSGITVISLGGAGGDAGIASNETGQGGNGLPGRGGNGGMVTATIAGEWSSQAGIGLYAASIGGAGGGGSSSSDAKQLDQSPQGVDACGGNPNDPTCTAGNGNTVNVKVTGTVSGQTYGAYIASIGGDGGTGGDTANEVGRSGGAGGNAGAGGDVTATLASTGIAVQSVSGVAFYVASLGGVGGTGGKSNNSGSGGTGGNAGTVTAEIDGNVSTAGVANGYGVLAQSLGGSGGNGGTSAAWFNPITGAGNTGGKSNTVTVTGKGARIVTGSATSNGDNSAGLLAQSVGGGGGVGPDSNGWFAVGGSGGTASNGQQVSVTLTNSSVSTYGFNSAGIIAQSIGGGGGKGGDATGKGYVVNLTVGGTGGGGGSANDANSQILDASQIQTFGKHSPGLQIQSIGGGGGDGGAAYGQTSSVFYGAAISVGGSGGAGGNGGTVNSARTENNSGQIQTFDTDSYGILGQSIGGGGGNGGASTAKSIVKGSSNYPSQSLALATGGSGGIAGSAGDVYLQSSGFVATTGGGSAGIVAQAIGGGGGNAGDASASASASGGNYNLAVSLAFGGTGGAAGDGGNVEATNNGLVITTGESATGLMVQSIGGGGGNGGAGDTKSSNSSSVNHGENTSSNKPSGKSLSFAVGSGGNGGGAGEGYNATATNTGAILTLGDSAHGILAQTIGGGGGNAGGGAASTQGDIQFDLQVGGTGGNGGDTYYHATVNVSNSGTIATYGADANGILAQSIGGGGGNGGKAGTSLNGGKSDQAGGNYANAALTSTLTAIEGDYSAKGVTVIDYYNILGNATTGVIGTINRLLGNVSLQVGLGDSDPVGDLDSTAGSGGVDNDDNNARSVSLKVGVGGNGGNGGAAGAVNVTNQAGATVATLGKHSDAIVAQSIGGGGGKGGSASSASSGNISGGIGVGGNGGNAGTNANNGGDPTVINNGSVYTMGALSAGIVAQSIGGGGGIGGTSSATIADSNGGGSGRKVGVTATLGGSSTKVNSVSGVALVNSSGAIETRGHDSYAIIAQSISGGGGVLKSLATDLDKGNGTTVSGNSASTSKDFNVKVQLGTDSTLVAGYAGSAFVTTGQGGSIVTRGDNGIGILAQAVAGGGGLVLGGKPTGSSAQDFLGNASKTGSVNPGVSTNPDDNQGVHVTVGANIDTYGNGGVGVFAQSVGGSGGIAGDIGHTMQLSAIGAASKSGLYNGNGGDIIVTVDPGATITTNGGNAPGIIAQTVGGGGGWITNNDNAYIGSAGGIGIGGDIFINVLGGVNAKGGASAGIFAQSTGGLDNGGTGTGHAIIITIGDQTAACTNPNAPCSAAVFGGSAFGPIAAAVYLRNGTNDVITNYGFVNTNEANDGYAFYADQAVATVKNYGVVTGNISVSNLNNGLGATYLPLSTVNLNGGTLTNAGVIDIGGTRTRTVTLTGDLVSTGTGRLIVDTDHVAGTGDLLAVTGKATISGIVEVHPSRISNKPVTVLTAAGGLTVDPALGLTDTSTLFDFAAKAAPDRRSLLIQPIARLSSAASGLGANRQAVAGNLQTLFDTGIGFDRGFGALLSIKDAASYTRALDALSGQTLSVLGAARFASSQSFVNSFDSGCASFDQDGAAIEQDHCGWARVTGRRVSQNATFNALGYEATQGTFQLGMQRRIGEGWYLGGTLGYETSEFNDDQHLGKITGDSVLAGAQLRYHQGPFRASLTLDGGYGWYKSRRTIIVGAISDQAKASPQAWHAGAHLRAGYEVRLGAAAYAKPFVDAHAVYVASKAFTEYGVSPYNLQVRRASEVALSGAAGLELGTRIRLSDKGFVRLFGGGQYAFLGNNDWRTTARFADLLSGPTFSIRTPAPRHLGRFATGVEVQVAPSFDLTLRYEPEIGRGYVSHGGLARLSWQF